MATAVPTASHWYTVCCMMTPVATMHFVPLLSHLCFVLSIDCADSISTTPPSSRLCLKRLTFFSKVKVTPFSLCGRRCGYSKAKQDPEEEKMHFHNGHSKSGGAHFDPRKDHCPLLT